ncbi:MAG: transcriptional regulator [Marinilabiliales bacterium]|nr:MAG: transcriptional regulator [Marinilabiliales bacterium]
MKKILIIEDDLIMRENMAELLTLVGYKINTAEDGKVGVEKAKSFLPDLIICDIRMPVLDGYGVLHILSKEVSTASIPFIFVTAKTERNDLRKGMEMGADDYLTKPFDDTELLKAVETRLKKSDLLSKPEKAKSKTINENDLINSINKLATNSEPTIYAHKEQVFKTGDYPHYLFFVEEGSVKTYRFNEEGKELISSIYHHGEFFGFKPIIENRTYLESAEAIEDSKLKRIPKDKFISLIGKNKNVLSKLVKIISKSLTEKEQELMQMAYDSVRKRVALRLIELIPDDSDSSITITRSDLAAMVGTTSETLVRTLAELKDLEIIETDMHSISLLNRGKLMEFAKNW